MEISYCFSAFHKSCYVTVKKINLTVCSLEIHVDSYFSYFKSLKSWTLYSNINSRNLTSASRPIIPWLLLLHPQFLKIGKIILLSSHHLSSSTLQLLHLSLEEQLSCIFSGKHLGENPGCFTDDWHCKHRILGRKGDKLVELKYTRTEEKHVDKNIWPTFSAQANSKWNKWHLIWCKFGGRHCWVLGSLAWRQHRHDQAPWALWTLTWHSRVPGD